MTGGVLARRPPRGGGRGRCDSGGGGGCGCSTDGSGGGRGDGTGGGYRDDGRWGCCPMGRLGKGWEAARKQVGDTQTYVVSVSVTLDVEVAVTLVVVDGVCVVVDVT